MASEAILAEPGVIVLLAVSTLSRVRAKLNHVRYRNDGVMNKDDKPFPPPINLESLSRIRDITERLDLLSRRISDAYAGVIVEDGLAEIEAATTAARKGFTHSILP